MSIKLIKQILDAQGNEQLIKGSVVVDEASGKNFEQIVTEVGGIPALIAKAVNVLKDGTEDGSGNLPADSDTLLKISTSLSALKKTVNDFLTGEADDGAMDRLVELVKAIGDNKGSIDALLLDKVNKTDIVDALTSTDAGKVLSAAQGKALKGLIDELDKKITDQIAALHTHDNMAVLSGIGKNAAGNLTYNNKVLDGATSIGFVGAAADAPTYDGKLVMVVSPYTIPAA